MPQSEILIVLPTLGDRLTTLRQTLESIRQQQTQVKARLVVVLPESAAEAKKLAEEYGATIAFDPKSGISAAINKGIECRQGEKYYAWMGDDDLFRPGGLKILAALLDSSESVVAYGACEYINSEDNKIATSRAGKWASRILAWGPDLIPHPGSMMRLDAMEQVGLYDESLKFVMDLDILLKLRAVGSFASTTNTVSAFRWHPNSLTVANRRGSSREAQQVKLSHLGPVQRILARLIFPIVFVAAGWAATALNRRAISLSGPVS